jgi:hypothetical protein
LSGRARESRSPLIRRGSAGVWSRAVPCPVRGVFQPWCSLAAPTLFPAVLRPAFCRALPQQLLCYVLLSRPAAAQH